jgi:hypothetical protein
LQLSLQEKNVKNFGLIFALSVFGFTAPGFAEENSGSTIELSAHQHGGSGHRHGGSRHGSHGHHGRNRSHHHSEARGHYHHGRFDDGYFGAHFGRGNLIIWGGPGFWYGAPWVSPFWFGGVYWGFGPGFVFLPEWRVGGWYVASATAGYVLLNPAFPAVQVPVVVNINLAPPAEQDEADESDQ